jgi:uncharacterized protein (TIGR03435 family)
MRALVLLLFAAVLPAQVFEVASIKPGDPGAMNWGYKEGDAGFTANNVPVRDLLLYAFDAKAYQISGGPKWIESAGYSIVAKLEKTDKPAPHGDGMDPRLQAAMRALLAERFQLQFHRETKEVSGYALVPAKNGFHLTPAKAASGSSWNLGNGRASFSHMPMPDLAEALARIVERPVVDATGISGAYDLKLAWAVDGTSDSRPSLFGALEDLGLKLEGRKVPVPLIVIDRIEKPSAN